MNRIVIRTNIKGETFRTIQALDDGTWWIYYECMHNAPWSREKFGLGKNKEEA